VAAGALLGLLAAACGQKGGLYLPDSAPARVHAPPATAAPATPGEPAAPAAPADDPATRRKTPTPPDPSTSQ